MKFKVTGKANYEYEVEAADEEDAISRALEQFDDDVSSHTRDPADVLDWKASPIEEVTK